MEGKIDTEKVRRRGEGEQKGDQRRRQHGSEGKERLPEMGAMV